MQLNKFRPILHLLAFIVFIYVLHKVVPQILPIAFNTTNFIYSLEELYGFFSVCSLFIMVFVIVVNIKNKDNVGMSFIIVTTLKIILSVIMVRPILHNAISDNIKLEKINFFIIFIFFLAIETTLTIRILNNKQ
ncbi:MAG TPA: hypothetical protein VF677_07225 [Flavobacterium sp.]|jgi:hypothetical protein